jgi:hypothetical protein
MKVFSKVIMLVLTLVLERNCINDWSCFTIVIVNHFDFRGTPLVDVNLSFKVKNTDHSINIPIYRCMPHLY